MSSPDIDRSIEEFCGSFLSFAVNFSSWGAPTVEIEMLAGSSVSLDNSALKSAESILKNYFPFIDVDNFRLANREIKKSSSGKIISERWVDKFWWDANGKFLGLSRTVGGDLMIGNEYHSVSGVYGQNRSIPNNYTMSDSFLRLHHRDLRTGMCSFEARNGWWRKDCKCNGFSSEEQLNDWRRAPGLENPEITLGEMYYTWPEFLLNSGFRKSQISKITNNGTPLLTVGNEITNIATGVFNNTGSYYSVINSIVNTFGWTYVPSCALGGHAFINPTGDFGKMSVLTNAGVSIPNNAVASSEVRDYSAGYVQGSFLSIKRPGREQDKESDDQQETPYTRYCASADNEPGDTSLTTVNVISKVSTAGSTKINSADCIWRFISDFPIFYELGLALWIERNGTLASGKQETWLKKIYDKAPSDYTFYTNCDGIINADPIEALQTLWTGALSYNFGDFGSGTIPQAIEVARSDINVASKVDALIANYQRFAFTDEISGDPISLAGDIVNPSSNGYKKLEDMTAREKFMQASGFSGGSQETFSFSHYGTQRYNFGEKSWSSSGGQVGYLDVSSDDSIGASPFSDFKQFGFSKITEFLDVYVPQRSNSGISEDSGQDYGIILVDQGPNTVSSFGEGGYGIAGNEVFLDQNPALEGGLGVIAAVRDTSDSGSLLDKAEQFIDEVSDVLEQNLSGNQENTRVSWHGVPEDLCWDSRDDANLNDNNESSGMSKEEVNEKAAEYCNAYSRDKWEITPKARTLQGKNPNVIHPNKKLHTFNIQWSLANDDKTLYYMDPSGRAQQLAYNNTESVHVPYLDKISFTLINDFYDLTGKMHLLENVSINVMDGKLTTTYTFSQKVQSPDFAGIFGGKVAFQNMVR